VARVFAMASSKNRDKQNLGRTKTGFTEMNVHFKKAVKACFCEPASACYAPVPPASSAELLRGSRSQIILT